jgi:glycerol uptake facilitator-like aquaporin
MDPISLLLILLLLSGMILISRLIGKAAERKGRSKWTFFWISFLLFPLGALVMGIIVATIAPPQASSEAGH